MMHRMRVLVLLLAWLGGVRAVAAEAPAAKRPITHEDVWLMKRVGVPAVSPDGRWAVFPLTEPAYDDGQVSDLWLVPTDGGAEPRRLTSWRSGEGGATWSPDGRRIAFSAKREGDDVEQIYVLDVVGGGEAQRLVKLVTGARHPRWRPDGKAILFTTDVYPGARSDADNQKAIEERKAQKYNARVYDAFPVRHWDRWLDERRPTLVVQGLEPGAAPVDLLAGTALAASPGFGGRLGNEGESLDAVWAPDGDAVVFVATVNRDAAARADTVHALWRVPATGGEPERLTPNAASHAAPTFSRDGRALFARMEPATRNVYNAERLVRWDWPWTGRAAESLTAGFDRSVGSFAVAPDGRSVHLLAEDRGREKLWVVGARGGPVTEVGALAAGCYGDLSSGGLEAPVLVAKWETAVSPPEIGRIDPGTGRWTALTRFNAARVAEIDWRPLEEFEFTSKRGKRIHNLVALPPGFDPSRKYPLLAVIHGGPHSMWRDQFVTRWNYHLLAAPGYVVLLTNYTGSTGFGEAFAQAIQGDPLEGPANELNEAADAAIARYPFIDASRQAAAGASYGGHLINWLATTTRRYRALVSHAGLYDLKSQWATSDIVYHRERNMGGPAWERIPGWREQSPFYRSAKLATPTLVTIGERDYRVPLNNALEFFTVLQRQNVPSRLVVFPEENHWILKGENSRFFYSEIREWLARFVPAG